MQGTIKQPASTWRIIYLLCMKNASHSHNQLRVLFPFFLNKLVFGVEGVARGIKPPLVTENYLLYRITYYDGEPLLWAIYWDLEMIYLVSRESVDIVQTGLVLNLTYHLYILWLVYLFKSQVPFLCMEIIIPILVWVNTASSFSVGPGCPQDPITTL